MTVDLRSLVQIMADFEQGAPLMDNPFDESLLEQPTAINAANAFLEGSAIPDTLAVGGDHEATALAGFLQGLAVGYEYSRREAWPKDKRYG